MGRPRAIGAVLLPLALPLLIGALGVGALGCTSAPIRNLEDVPLDAPYDFELGEVSEAIWRAGRRRGWVVEQRAPGDLIGTLRIRRHVAVVQIRHDVDDFSIRYFDSENLDYHADRGEIHENYNVWVERLAREIKREPIYRQGQPPLARRSTAPPPRRAPSPSRVLPPPEPINPARDLEPIP